MNTGANLKVGYISLNITPDGKSVLNDLVHEGVDDSEYCQLRYKGGNVTRKAHLTLFFGLDYERLNLSVIKELLIEIKRDIISLHPLFPDVFHLRKSPCNAWVLLIEPTEKLLYYHKYLRDNFPVIKSAVERDFIPHITMAYIQKDTSFNNLNTLPKRLLIDDIQLKIFPSYRINSSRN